MNVLLPELISVLETLHCAYEIVIVDDGSTDGTARAVTEWSISHPQIVYVQFSRNFGKEAALSAGLEVAQGEVVVCMDSDLQHAPTLIPAMLDRWYHGVDMVYTVRSKRDDESIFKRAGAKLFYKLMRTPGGLTVPENAGDFRLMDRAVVNALLMLPERNRFMKGLYAWVGFRSEPFYFTPTERLHGTTRFKPYKLFRFALDGLTAFTTWPLRLLSVLGILLSLVSFAYGLYIMVSHFFYGDLVQGWTTLIMVILFFAGVQLISLGVVGEYIARIFGEVKSRPIYIVRKQLGKGLGTPNPADRQGTFQQKNFPSSRDMH